MEEILVESANTNIEIVSERVVLCASEIQRKKPLKDVPWNSNSYWMPVILLKIKSLKGIFQGFLLKLKVVSHYSWKTLEK